MKYQAILRMAAAVLSTALIATGAVAQTRPTAPVITDTAPPPPEDRNSMGAVIMMDEPVLAQREAMERMMAGAPDTRSMGAGPARLLRDIEVKDEKGKKRALEAADIQKDGGKASTPDD
jgi:hypothetical protein